jgi:hypothetical protein
MRAFSGIALAAVAYDAKMARIIWAMLVTGESYRADESIEVVGGSDSSWHQTPATQKRCR